MGFRHGKSNAYTRVLFYFLHRGLEEKEVFMTDRVVNQNTGGGIGFSTFQAVVPLVGIFLYLYYRCKLYADDRILFVKCKNVPSGGFLLQGSIDRQYSWCSKKQTFLYL